MLENAQAEVELPETGTCPCCGQKIGKLNPHRMDASKVRLLEKIARINRDGHAWVKLQRDGSLIKDRDRNRTVQVDDVHGLRLKWFGLVDCRGRRTGEYCINENGRLFLAGRLAVPSRIFCRGGKVIEIAPDKVTIDQVRNVFLNKAFWDDYKLMQKKPGEMIENEPASEAMAP